jgi:hypothetical protein
MHIFCSTDSQSTQIGVESLIFGDPETRQRDAQKCHEVIVYLQILQVVVKFKQQDGLGG